jgi:4-amino-4-deoxy-L-arabinose transferase-like glycosyltransferase
MWVVSVTRAVLGLNLSDVSESARSLKAVPRPARRADGTPRAARWRPAHGAAFAGLTALAVTVFFFHLGVYGLWPDEARYAEIAREMVALGDYILPHLNYVAYIEKPPLLYWLTAISFHLFGVTQFAARLTVAASALVGLAATCFFAHRSFGRSHALLAGAVLTTTVLYAAMAQVLTTDMLLTALMTVAFFAFFLHWSEGGRWCWLFYFAMALAVLTKGPIGAALPIAVAILFLWGQGELTGAVGRFKVVSGILVMVAISAPWFIVMTIREPGYFSFYFVGEYLRRFFQSGYSHAEPIYFYVPVLAVGMLPWSLMVPFLSWRNAAANPARRFCAIVAAAVFVLFSLASAKLIPYILPAIPALAVLIADGIIGRISVQAGSETGMGRCDSQIFAVMGPLMGLFGAGTIVVALLAPHFRSPYPAMLQPVLGTIGAILMIGGVLCAAAFWLRRAEVGLAVLVLTTTAALLVGGYGRLRAEPRRSYAALCREVEAEAPHATLICYRRYVQTLPFYTHRRVILVGDKTELAFGAAHSPDAGDYFFTTDADLLRLWKRPGPTVVVLDAWDLKRLGKRLGNFRVIASESKKRAIIRVDDQAAGN